MDFSNKRIKVIRYYGRKLVLPSSEIQHIVCEQIFNKGINIDYSIDFGGGTLFWSKWLHKYVKNVISVDTFYEKEEIKDGIVLCNDLNEAYKYIRNEKSLIWISDVLHHLSPKMQNLLLEESINNHNWIVIKDIDCRCQFGNFMNKLHDKVINNEIIRDINPEELYERLQKKGYKVSFFSLHKLWYPHFLIIAEK